MTIRSRIITTFVVIFALTILSLASQKMMINKGEALNEGLDHINLELVALLALESAVNKENQNIAAAIDAAVPESSIYLMSERLSKAFDDVWEINKDYHVPELFDGFEKSERDETGLETLLKEKQERLLQGQKQIEKLLADGDQDGALLFVEDFYTKELGPEFVSIIDKWIYQEQSELSESRKEHDRYVSFHLNMMNGIGFVFLAVLLWLSYSLNRTIGYRLDKLVDHTRELAKGNFIKLVDIKGNDELTRLAMSFNEMTAQLSKTQDRLLEQSYQSGMSEVAADILHNVKNSFSGILSGCEKVNSLVRGARIVKLRMAVKKLINDKDALGEAERASILEYIELATLDLEEQYEKIREANNQIESTFFLIDSILTDQYRYTKVDHPMQWCNLYRILKDTIFLLEDMCRDVVTIEIDRAIEKLGDIKTHRIVFIQIITNIITNAVESIIRNKQANGQIMISGFAQGSSSDEMIHLSFRDNGVGIGPGNFETLFKRGRSSKSDIGHTGLGLHWVANVIQNLDGRIYAESDGVGEGATFHLIFRRKARERQ